MGVDVQDQIEKVALLDVSEVSRLLGCSVRHCYRMADAGRMPAPVKLGALVRWNRASIESWIGQGCPRVRAAKARPESRGK